MPSLPEPVHTDTIEQELEMMEKGPSPVRVEELKVVEEVKKEDENEVSNLVYFVSSFSRCSVTNGRGVLLKNL